MIVTVDKFAFVNEEDGEVWITRGSKKKNIGTIKNAKVVGTREYIPLFDIGNPMREKPDLEIPKRLEIEFSADEIEVVPDWANHEGGMAITDVEEKLWLKFGEMEFYGMYVYQHKDEEYDGTYIKMTEVFGKMATMKDEYEYAKAKEPITHG